MASHYWVEADDGTAALLRQGDAKYKGVHFLDKNPTYVTVRAPPLEDETKWQNRTIVKVVYQGVRCGGHCSESVLYNHPDGLSEIVPYIINEDASACHNQGFSPHNTHKRLLSWDGAVAKAI